MKSKDNNEEYICCSGKTKEEAENCQKTQKCCEEFDIEQNDENEKPQNDDAQLVVSKTNNNDKAIKILIVLLLVFAIVSIAYVFLNRTKPEVVGEAPTNKAANLTIANQEDSKKFSIFTQYDAGAFTFVARTSNSNYKNAVLTLEYMYNNEIISDTRNLTFKDNAIDVYYDLPEDTQPQFVLMKLHAETLDDEETTNVEFNIGIPDNSIAFSAFAENLAKDYPALEGFHGNTDGTVDITVDENELDKIGDSNAIESALKSALSQFDMAYRNAGHSSYGSALNYKVVGLASQKTILSVSIINGEIQN